MFHKAKTEAERQKIFDEYFLNLLKKKKNIKRNQKIIDNSMMNFDPLNQDKQAKGVFNSFVDSLVIKNFLIEQLYTRLKLNKNVVQSFVNKLNSNDILIMNKTLNEYIQYIKDNYETVNDYILKNSFNELKKNYNVKELQEKNKEIITQNQEETNDTIRDNIPEKTLKQGGVSVGGVEETKGEAEEMTLGATDKETDEGGTDDVSRLSTDDDEDEGATEEIKANKFLENTVFKLQGSTTMGVVMIKRKIFGLVVMDDADYFSKQGKTPTQGRLDNDLGEFIKSKLNKTPEENKEEVRQKFQRKVISSFLTVTKDLDVQDKNYNLFLKYIRLLRIQGSGMKQRRKMIGRGFVSEDKYLKLGKCKANKEKLLGGKLQIRSENENQVNNVKSQMITKI